MAEKNGEKTKTSFLSKGKSFSERNKRRWLTVMRTGTNSLRLETGRWEGEEVKDRTCRVCMSNDVEDECHFVLNCPVYERERKKMFDSIRETTGYDMSCMENDWKMDALIGDGLCSFRSEIRACDEIYSSS